MFYSKDFKTDRTASQIVVCMEYSNKKSILIVGTQQLNNANVKRLVNKYLDNMTIWGNQVDTCF